MKFRARSLALLLSASFVGLCSVPVLPSTAYAQDDAVLKMARERFQEGVKYYDQKKYDDARAAFLQAYALKKHPAVLLNLAQSELHSGHEADAAKHFAKFLREGGAEASASEKQDAQKGLAAARAKVAEITVTVNQANAEVFVDNQSQGKAPLAGPIYLMPGSHTIEARQGGKAGTVNVNAAAGMTNSVSITIGAPPTTMPAAAAGGPPPAGAAPPMGGGEPTAPTGPATNPPPPGGGPGDQAGGGFKMDTSGSREPFLKWAAHNKLAWVGGGVTVVGLGAGIGFALASHSAYGSADDVAAKIKADFAQTHPGENPAGLCNNPSLASRYGNACKQYQDNVNTGDTDKTLSVVGFVLAGVAAGGTVVYYFVDSKKKPADSAAADNGVRAAFVPIVAPSVGGLGVVGTF